MDDFVCHMTMKMEPGDELILGRQFPQVDCVLRVQRKRTKGWRMPRNTVYVGRPSQWGNPFYKLGNRTLIHASGFFTDLYELWIGGQFEPYLWHIFCDGEYREPPTREEIKQELHGMNLCCWCSTDFRCHGDNLLRMANK